MPEHDHGDDVLDGLRSLLVAMLPDDWTAAVDRDDVETIERCRAELDSVALVRRLGAEGWVAPDWPADYGGRGLDRRQAKAAIAELDRWRVPRGPGGAGLSLAAPTILEWASDDTKRRFLPAIVTGEERWCQLFSEPGAGSDLASLATTAVRDGDEWIVNGQKVWTTLGHEAEFGMLLARTDPTSPKNAGITYFGIDLRQPGVEVRPLVQMTGETEFNEVFLSDARIPDLYRISPVGQGWGATLTTLGAERIALSGGSSSAGGRSSTASILGGKRIDEVIALARATDGLSDRVVRDRLMKEYIDARVLRLTSGRLGGEIASGRLPPAAGSLTKVAKAKTNQSLQVLAMELLGAQAVAWLPTDLEVPSFIREFLRTRANSIEGGTSEVQRNIVGERVLGLPREPDPYKGQAWKDTPRS